MIKNANWRPLLPILILFLILNAFFIVGRNFFEKWNMDNSVLVGGNLVLFLASLSSYFLATRSLHSTNPHAIVRSMYGSFLVKLFICILAAIFYILLVKENVNKPALFTCMGIYVIYSILEVSALTKLMKKKKNA